MQLSEEHIQDFHTMIPWKYQDIIRYDWTLHHKNTLTRDLDLWFCEPNKQKEPMRLKVKAYDVNRHAYVTLFSGWRVAIRVHLDEHMNYVFMDTYDDVLMLFTCKNFTFHVEDAAYDEM